MKKTAVKIISYFLLTVAGAAAGWGGTYAVQLFAQPDGTAPVQAAPAQPQPGTDAVQLRVRDGQMEWFDGVRWNTAASVETLKQSDATEAESDAWRALSQQRAAAKEEQRQQSLALFDKEQNALSTGEKPAALVPVRRPAAQTTTPPATTTPPPATPTPDPTPPPAAPDSTPEWSGDHE